MASTIQVNMHEAKSQLSQLAERAWAGEHVVIARAGKPYLDLMPHRDAVAPARRPGRLKGRVVVHPDFDAADADIADSFDNSR